MSVQFGSPKKTIYNEVNRLAQVIDAGLFPAALGASGKTFQEVLGADFNSYTSTGFYELHGTAERPLKNSPVSPVNPADAGDWYVMVLSRATTLWVTQVAFSVRGDQALMVRVLNNGVWGDWKDVGIHQYLHGSQILADTDLNTLEQREEVGWYYGTGNNTCPNKPDGVNAFSLMLLRTDHSAYLQICFDADTARMYTRTFHAASGWKEWQETSGVQIVQGTGQSTTAVMSQKAVTDQLAGKANTFNSYPNLTAGNATHANVATTALAADKATQDGDGNDIETPICPRTVPTWW